MIIFGTYNTAPFTRFDPFQVPGIDQCAVLNLYSLSEQGDKIYNLIPYPHPPLDVVASPDQLQFDVMYADFLMNNQYAFRDLMTIMYPLYENSGLLIYILIGTDAYRDAITQSLMKFIQERYGYISNYINTLEDLEFVQESTFSPIGIRNMDYDKERYVQLLAATGGLTIERPDVDDAQMS